MARPPSRGAAAPRRCGRRRRDAALRARRGAGMDGGTPFLCWRPCGWRDPLPIVSPFLDRRKGRKQTGSTAKKTPSECMGLEKRSSNSQQELAIYRHTAGAGGRPPAWPVWAGRGLHKRGRAHRHHSPIDEEDSTTERLPLMGFHTPALSGTPLHRRPAVAAPPTEAARSGPQRREGESAGERRPAPTAVAAGALRPLATAGAPVDGTGRSRRGSQPSAVDYRSGARPPPVLPTALAQLARWLPCACPLMPSPPPPRPPAQRTARLSGVPSGLGGKRAFGG